MPIAEKIDEFIWIKNRYSFLKHFVPFSIASLLLIVLSVPEENLLVQLAKLLERPNIIWVPAAFLTIISIFVYYYTIKAQITRSYLWDNGVSRRSKFTAVMYIFLCTILAGLVLVSCSMSLNLVGGIWSSLLVALLSLTGIGWSTPGSWVESMGVNSPDYAESHHAANEIKKILNYVRKSSNKVTLLHIENFIKYAENLKDNMNKNLEIEPREWGASKKLIEAMLSLDELIKSVKDDGFEEELNFEGFRVACLYEMGTIYNTVESLKKAELFWQDWQSNPR